MSLTESSSDDRAPNERVDDLGGGYSIIQNPLGFCFGMDAVLLSAFAGAKQSDVTLDIGTGTGIIPILLAKKYGVTDCRAVEIQPNMADMAARSVRLNGLQDVISVLEGDIRDTSLIPPSCCDLITCNPPYTGSGGGLRNKNAALSQSRHELSLNLDELLTAAYRILKFRGRLCLVYRANRLTDLLSALRTHKLEPKILRFVQSRIGESPKLILVEAVRNGGAFLTLPPPLLIYREDGEYTDEVRGMYYG